MKKTSFTLSVLLIVSFFILYTQYTSSKGVEGNQKMISMGKELKDEGTLSFRESSRQNKDLTSNYEGLHTLIGKSGDEIIELWGKPERIDPSSYDYVWWIYKHNEDNYVQVGILNNKVATIYGIGSEINIDPFYINQSISEIAQTSPILAKHSLNIENNSYRFELTEEEQQVRPLFQLGDVWVQLYIDQFTNKLSSVRYLDASTLIKQRPYELIYRGELLYPRELTKEEWFQVEKGSSKQILDITNIIRRRHNLKGVKWHEETANVAVLHSRDMKEKQYFSHNSPTTGGLADRLNTGNIKYHLAGENIAAKYVDGIAAIEGWLNSEGHRETLLNVEFTHLGVGVYEKYFTQNFISTWEPKK